LHVVDEKRDRTAARKAAEKTEDAHREGKAVDLGAGAPDRSEERRSLRLGERRQASAHDLPECVSERRKRELRLRFGRPTAEDVPAATPCLLAGCCEQRRLSDAGLALQEESARLLRERFEELSDVFEFGVPSDDRF
jgi:hypothetical protein